MKFHLLLDLDDVLVDFVSAAARIHGKNPIEIHARRSGTCKWDIQDLLNVDLNQFWRPIHEAGADFWEKLPDLPWTDDLIKLANDKFGDNWSLCTGPSRDETSQLGKIRWAKNKFGSNFDINRLILTGHKHVLSSPRNILVDDRTDNIEKFVSVPTPGYGIVFPNSGNAFWHVKDHVEHVSEQLELIAEIHVRRYPASTSKNKT